MTDQPESGADSGAEGEAAPDWRDGLPSELRPMAERMNTPHDAVKVAADLRHKLSRAIVPPDDSASEDERNAFYSRLGRPATPDGYDYTRPETLPDHLVPDDAGVANEGSFLAAMHQAGATPAVVQAAFDWYYGMLTETVGDSPPGIDRGASIEAATSALRREWGSDYDKNLELANRAFNTFGGADVVEAFNQHDLSNHPAVVRAFARIGLQMGEDDMITGSLDGMSDDDLKKKAENLMAEDDYWTNESTQTEVRSIMERLYGNTPINPSDH
jgi:hypothetical protein